MSHYVLNIIGYSHLFYGAYKRLRLATLRLATQTSIK